MRRISLALSIGVLWLWSGLAAAASVSVINGILTVSYESTTGQFTVLTGASYPGHPNAQVLFPTGTSYITLRDVTGTVVYANDTGETPPTGYTFQSFLQAPCTAVTAAISLGFTATYTCPNWTVVQTVQIQGTQLTDTAVRQTVAVTNTSAASRQYGVRYMWDWEINGVDASLFRTRNPDSPFTSTFIGYTNPTFQAFEEVDNASTPSFSVFGTISGGSLSPAPTPPDRFGYVSWGDAVDNPWDFPITGGNSDSATVHYFGFTAPLTLAAGGTNSFVEYLTTIGSAINVGPPPPVTGPVNIPTLTEWGLIALSTLVAGMALVSLRRRSMR